MGYYSDVMLITEVENADTVMEIFEELKGSGSPPNILEWANIPEGLTYKTGGYGGNPEKELIMWEWSGMRWGYNFTRTDEIEKALDERLTYEDEEYPRFGEYPHFGLIVIGEDIEDTRFVGSPFDYGMWVERKITW